jgi:hypothetical protein
MVSVQTGTENARPSSFREISVPPLTTHSSRWTNIAATVRTIIEDPSLESYLDQNQAEFDALSSDVQRTLDAAFERGDERALADVHAMLFALYDLFVAPAASVRCHNQFNPYLIRLRGAIERRWLESPSLSDILVPADLSTPEDLVQAICSVSAQHRASKHPLFDFLETQANLAQLTEFFRSDSALNIRFFDLIVLALLGSDPAVRGELSQNFWDEAGKGDPLRSHVTLFRNLLLSTGIAHAEDDHASLLNWQGLAGYNLFMMTGLNRSQGFKSLGVMAVTELLDPSQYEKLTRGCRRLGLGTAGELEYYDEHVSIDVVHAEGWLSNVIVPLAGKFPQRMSDIFVGAQWRLNTCAEYYDNLHERLLQIA